MIGTGSKLSLGRKDGSATEFLLDLSGPPIAFAAYHFDPHTLLAVILLSFADREMVGGCGVTHIDDRWRMPHDVY
jgi:hypothetical protein